MSPLELPSRIQKTFWYLGVDENLALGESGTTDLGEPIEFVALSAEYAPAGFGGEAIFTDLRLTLFRDNDEDMVLEVTPIVDGERQDPIDLELPAVAEPARAIHELGLANYHPSPEDPQYSTALRGTYFQVELRTPGAGESVDLYNGRLVIEEVELEWDPVREGRSASNATA